MKLQKIKKQEMVYVFIDASNLFYGGKKVWDGILIMKN